MRRFAYVCADAGIPVPGLKGASIHVQSVCRALVDAGLDGQVLCARPEAETLCGLPVHGLFQKTDVPPVWRGSETGKFLTNLDADVDHAAGCDFIYERYSLWHVAGLARARRLGVPFILEVNSPLPEEAARFRGLGNAALAEGVARALMLEADGVVCVSNEIGEWVAERRETDEGVWVVPNGVDPRRFRPGAGQRQPPLPQADVPLIAFAGSFRPWHGTDDLARAFCLLVDEHVPQAHLVCVGDGPERAAFERTIREHGLGSRLHMTGPVDHSEVAGWLAGADVAVAPYPELASFYFSPLKIFEFMALGLPVVAGDVGQIPQLIPHGRRGLLYPPGRPRELAAALAHVLNDRGTARRMGADGREWVLAHATWDTRVATILDNIRGLNRDREGKPQWQASPR